MRRRTFLIVLDGVGVGDAPDAAAFGDEGSDSLGNTARLLGGLPLPTLGRLGLGHLTDIPGTPADPHPAGGFGKIAEISAGKDSTTGHWEMCGLVTPKAFPTYPGGFPAAVIERFERAIGRGTLGNRAASGTDILRELGDEHVQSGRPIVYTSADSVFQIAVHEDVVPLDQLYRWCQIARTQLQSEHNVGRVIARPFTGPAGAYARTPHRRDFAVLPPGRSLLDVLKDDGRHVIGVGKIEDLFSGLGLTASDHTTSNHAGMAATRKLSIDAPDGALIFTNLNDFDSLWGHRNDPQGYAGGLRVFDAWMAEFLAGLRAGDLLLVTSDHGNDPTTPSTDHSREYIPILGSLHGAAAPGPIGTRTGLADIAATVLEHLGHAERMGGRSFRGALGVL